MQCILILFADTVLNRLDVSTTVEKTTPTTKSLRRIWHGARLKKNATGTWNNKFKSCFFSPYSCNLQHCIFFSLANLHDHFAFPAYHDFAFFLAVDTASEFKFFPFQYFRVSEM